MRFNSTASAYASGVASVIMTLLLYVVTGNVVLTIIGLAAIPFLAMAVFSSNIIVKGKVIAGAILVAFLAFSMIFFHTRELKGSNAGEVPNGITLTTTPDGEMGEDDENDGEEGIVINVEEQKVVLKTNDVPGNETGNKNNTGNNGGASNNSGNGSGIKIELNPTYHNVEGGDNGHTETEGEATINIEVTEGNGEDHDAIIKEAENDESKIVVELNEGIVAITTNDEDNTSDSSDDSTSGGEEFKIDIPVNAVDVDNVQYYSTEENGNTTEEGIKAASNEELDTLYTTTSELNTFDVYDSASSGTAYTEVKSYAFGSNDGEVVTLGETEDEIVYSWNNATETVGNTGDVDVSKEEMTIIPGEVTNAGLDSAAGSNSTNNDAMEVGAATDEVDSLNDQIDVEGSDGSDNSSTVYEPVHITSLDDGRAYRGDTVQFKLFGDVKEISGLDGLDATVVDNIVTINTNPNEVTEIILDVLGSDGSQSTASVAIDSIN